MAGVIVKSLKAFDERTALVFWMKAFSSRFLYSLPVDTGEMNIAMGLPLAQTPLSDMLNLVFRMHLNKEKFTVNHRNGTRLFYFGDVLAVLRHPFISGYGRRTDGGNNCVFDRMVKSVARGE